MLAKPVADRSRARADPPPRPGPPRRGRRALDWSRPLAFWRDALGLELEVVVDMAHDRVRIAFLPVGESKIELVEPTDDTTGVARFLATKARASTTSASRSRTSPRRSSRLEIDGIELIDTAPRKGAEGPSPSSIRGAATASSSS